MCVFGLFDIHPEFRHSCDAASVPHCSTKDGSSISVVKLKTFSVGLHSLVAVHYAAPQCYPSIFPEEYLAAHSFHVFTELYAVSHARSFRCPCGSSWIVSTELNMDLLAPCVLVTSWSYVVNTCHFVELCCQHPGCFSWDAVVKAVPSLEHGLVNLCSSSKTLFFGGRCESLFFFSHIIKTVFFHSHVCLTCL